MSRYYFHLMDEAGQHDDHVGTELPDVADARREAVARAEVLIAKRSVEAWYSHAWCITVRDETGHEVLRLTIQRRPQHH